jgi:hypothetical protein
MSISVKFLLQRNVTVYSPCRFEPLSPREMGFYEGGLNGYDMGGWPMEIPRTDDLTLATLWEYAVISD